MTGAEETYDVAIVGSGQGGVPLAVALRDRGKRVVVFERSLVGGTCVNNGCTPSKAFLAAAHSAGRARRAGPLGIKATVDVDAPAVFERVRRIIGEWRDGVEAKFADGRITLVRAEASFRDATTLEADGIAYRAQTIVLDTGARPVEPRIDGLAGTPYLTNETFFDLPGLPRRMIVLGSGYIGCELGQGAARLGSAVTIVAPDDRVLPREEDDVCAAITRSLEVDGMRVRLGCRPKAVAYDGAVWRVTVDNGETLEADAVLVATGRAPNVPAGAREAGIACDDHGTIVVDAHLRTRLPNVFAIGDCAGQPNFTHVAWEDHRRVLDVMDGGNRTRDDRVLAYGAYTEPQLGRAGLTLEQARAHGFAARAETIAHGEVARGIEWGVEDGFFRLVAEERTGTLLGATFVGYEAAELVQVVQAVMQTGGTWRDLERTVFVHPTFCEGIASVARAFSR